MLQLRADTKMMSQALGCISSTYQWKGNRANAVKFYRDSLSMFKTPVIQQKLHEVQIPAAPVF